MYSSFMYKKSPVWLQESMLTLRGRLRAMLREGKTFERMLREIDGSQRMSADGLESFQVKMLRRLLAHAGDNVPYYRQLFGSIGFEAARLQEPSQIGRLPILRKQDIRNSAHAFLSQKHRGLKVHAHTSGTTNIPLTLYRDLPSINRENAFIRRQLQWAGFSPGDRRVWFYGDLVVPTSIRRPPFWRFNAADNMLVMSAFHLSEEHCPQYIEALRKFDPAMIQSYASSIGFLARWLWNRGATVRIPSLKGIVTTSEILTDEQRSCIETVFGVRVFDWYGSAERVAAIGTCEHGSYHIISDYGFVEMIPGDDGACEIVSTGFYNFLMPLVRYGSGDCVVPADPADSCPCGRPFPLVRKILGRSVDTVKTPDGRHVFGHILSLRVFGGIHGVVESQMVQERHGALDIRVVHAEGLQESTRLQIVRRAQELLGDEMEITLSEVKEIPRTRNGKLRAVVCLI